MRRFFIYAAIIGLFAIPKIVFAQCPQYVETFDEFAAVVPPQSAYPCNTTAPAPPITPQGSPVSVTFTGGAFVSTAGLYGPAPYYVPAGPVQFVNTGYANGGPNQSDFLFYNNSCPSFTATNTMTIQFSQQVVNVGFGLSNFIPPPLFYEYTTYEIKGNDGTDIITQLREGTITDQAGIYLAGPLTTITISLPPTQTGVNNGAGNLTWAWSYGVSHLQFTPYVPPSKGSWTLTANPDNGYPGDTVIVTGSNWPNPTTASQYNFYFESGSGKTTTTQLLGSVSTGACFPPPASFQFQVPASDSPGSYNIVAELVPPGTPAPAMKPLSPQPSYPTSAPAQFTVDQPVTVTFQKSTGAAITPPLRIGITIGAHDRTQQLQAVVQPSTATSTVTLTASNQLKLSSIQTKGNIITFSLVGVTKSNNRGDALITATANGTTVGTLSVSVLVPGQVGTPHDTGTGETLVIKNFALNETTSPVAIGVPSGQVWLVTGYYYFLTITVLDQFGGKIGDLYSGSTVTETWIGDGQNHNTNQNLTTNSTYTDPTGYGKPLYIWGNFVSATSTQAKDWVKATTPTLPLPISPVSWTDNLPVQVDGFDLNPAIVNRQITTNIGPPPTITIIWP